jgi:hypothetical protein
MESSRLKATAVTITLSTAIPLALFVAACDKDPPGGPSPRPTGVIRLELTGPASLPPGGEEQFRATAYLSDGSQRDVTTEAAWTSANSSIVSVSASGRATARERGETDIRVAFSQVISTNRVMVLPPGTFKLSGRVLDADSGLGVTDARVEVTGGSAAGLSTLSQDGHYALYGVSGQTPIRGTKVGYAASGFIVSVTNHRTQDLPLVSLTVPFDPSGTYTLTITAAPECRTALPEDAWVRTYRAVITLWPSNARYVNVTVEGAGVVTFSRQFWGGEIRESSLIFSGAYPLFDDGPPLVERLASSRFFFVDESPEWWPYAVVSRMPTGLAGSYHGMLAIGEGDVPANASLITRCVSRNHGFTFSR